MRLLALLFAFLLSFPALAQQEAATGTPAPGVNAAAQQGSQTRVFIRAFPDRDAAIPGTTIRLAIEQLIVPGWHTYWINPGDSGEPMRIKWDLPQGYEVSDMLWPAPEHIPYGPLMNYGYSDHAVMLADLTVPAVAKPGTTVPVRGKVTVLVCDEICIPESHDIALDIPVRATSKPVNADIFSAAGALLPQPVDWQAVTELNANEVRVRVTLPSYAAPLFGGEDEEIEFFPIEYGYLNNAADQNVTYEPSTGTLTLRQARATDRDMSAFETLDYVIAAGEKSWVISGKVTGITAPVMGQGPVAPATDYALITLILFAFIGGVILNLMPCVFPVLSMKALHLVSLPHAERAHAQKSGLLYAAGIIVMFLALAGVLFALRAAGHQLGWGFQLQNPAFVAALAWLVFVVGLNLAGMFDLRIAFGGEMLLAEKHHPLLSSFLSGVLATLVATPCSAPFMATAVGAAMTQSMPVALLIFAFLGLGLAAPFLLLSLVPSFQKFMPRPGAWMETFRQVLAFPMFASAVWLIWVIAQQGGPGAVAWTLSGMVALVFAIWLAGRQPVTRAGRSIVMAAGLAVLIATLSGLALIRTTAGETQDVVELRQSARGFTPAALEKALTDTTDPVFVNMTASWCITCLVNERVVLSTPEIHDLFKNNNMIYLKGDWTNRDPAITAYLQSFGRSGVPIYVFYGAPDADGVRPPAQVLPQILSNDTMTDLFKEEM